MWRGGVDPVTRKIKLDVTRSYVKRQKAKMKLLSTVFSSLNSRVKIFVFVANSRTHFSFFMWFNEGLEEKNTNSEVIFAVCRLMSLLTLCARSKNRVDPASSPLVGTELPTFWTQPRRNKNRKSILNCAHAFKFNTSFSDTVRFQEVTRFGADLVWLMHYS